MTMLKRRIISQAAIGLLNLNLWWSTGRPEQPRAVGHSKPSAVFAMFKPAHRGLWLFVCSLLLSPLVVKGHGTLVYPMSRNYIANSDYCPHCLNAGGEV